MCAVSAESDGGGLLTHGNAPGVAEEVAERHVDARLLAVLAHRGDGQVLRDNPEDGQQRGVIVEHLPLLEAQAPAQQE